MSLLKRLVTTVHASVDRTVAGIENHDAIVEAALKESRSAAAKARVRLNRVSRDGQRLRERSQDLQTEISQWNDRAVSTAATDRDKARECLSRRKQCESQLQITTTELAEHDRLEQRVRDSVTEIEQRLQTLQQQRNHMRSRESAAQAMRIVNALDDQQGFDIDDTFDRWEISISETEVNSSLSSSASITEDTLQHEFQSAETSAELDEELNALLLANQEHRNE